MITRDTKDCLNPYKHHLFRLPDIPKDRQPASYKDDSKECLVIFPLFQTTPGDTSLEHHIVRSALWARNSWIQFSDAVNLGVKIGFYVGDTVLNRVIPILKNNGVDPDTHVFLMKEAPFEGDPCTHLGKKMAMWVDTQFSEYQWILQFDSDMFIGSKSKSKIIPFFEYIANHELIPGAIASHKHETQNLHNFHWYKRLDIEQSDSANIKIWKNRAEQLVSELVIRKYFDSNANVGEAHGGIYAMPAKHMHTEKWDECKWIAKAGKLLQDDEAVFSLWITQGKPMFSIYEEMDVPFCSEIQNLLKCREKKDPYFSHIGHIYHEWAWRTDIDAL